MIDQLLVYRIHGLAGASLAKGLVKKCLFKLKQEMQLSVLTITNTANMFQKQDAITGIKQSKTSIIIIISLSYHNYTYGNVIAFTGVALYCHS